MIISGISKRSIARRDREIAAAEALRTSPVRLAKIVGRRTDGLSRLADVYGDCVAADGICGSCNSFSRSFRQESNGTVIIVESPRQRQYGVSGAGFVRQGSFDIFVLNSQDPVDLPRGKTTAVTYAGLGLKSSLEIEYLLPMSLWVNPAAREVHPGVSIANLVVVDSETATADVTVTADAIQVFDEFGEPVSFPIWYDQ